MGSTAATLEWQRVYTVNEYYDGEVFGLAEFNGEPYAYDREWDENADEYGSHFLLAPVEPDLLALVLEDWEIWLRWQAAYHQKLATEETHPALPEERERHEALQSQIGDRLNARRRGALRVGGKFRYRDGLTQVLWNDA
jgi:hypothetical protein